MLLWSFGQGICKLSSVTLHKTFFFFINIFIYIIFHLFESWIIDDEWGNRYILFYFRSTHITNFLFPRLFKTTNFEFWRRMALGDYITLREMREVGWGRSSWAKKKESRKSRFDWRAWERRHPHRFNRRPSHPLAIKEAKEESRDRKKNGWKLRLPMRIQVL